MFGIIKNNKWQEDRGVMTELSLVDVINLKNNPSRESRLLIAEKVCDQFNARHFSDEETIIVAEIFRLMAKDAEVAIRQAMAEKLKHNSRLPEDIAFVLANDVLQVALPVLQFSPVLSENDLTVIVRGTKELAKLVAISKRDVVTPAIAHEIVVKQEVIATETLLRNKGASIASVDLQAVVDEFSGSESLMTAMVERQVLPAAIVEKMLVVVTESLKTQLVKKHREQYLDIAQAAEDAREDITISHIAAPAVAEQKAELVEAMQQSNRLSSSVIIRAICKGDTEFFAESIARLTGTPKARIGVLMQEKNMDALSRLYRAAGLPESVSEATMLVLSLVLEEKETGRVMDSGVLTSRVIERIVSHGYDKSVNNMAYLMTLVGKKPSHHTLH